MREYGHLFSFDRSRGFGFVASETQPTQAFVHIRDLEKAGLENVEVGDKLSFERVKAPDGRTRADFIQAVGW